MEKNEFFEEAMGFAEMTYMEKFWRTWELFKENGLTLGATIFLTFLGLVVVTSLALVIVFFLGGSIFMPIEGWQALDAATFASLSYTGKIFLILGVFVFYVAIYILSFALCLGIASLLLSHVHDENPESIVRVVLDPLKRLNTIIWPISVLMVISFVGAIIMQLVVMIPTLGWIIYFVGTIFLSVFQVCFCFFLADNEGLTVGEALGEPARIVWNDVMNWVGSFLLVLLTTLLIIIVKGIALALISALFGGGLEVVLLTIVSVLFYMGLIIYSSYFMVLTYRQSLARFILGQEDVEDDFKGGQT